MRVFVAIELEQPLKTSLGKLTDALSAFRKDVRWVKPHQMHLTLKFLGEVADDRVPALCDAAREVAAASTPFTLELDRCGCFPPKGKVRVIWGGTDSCPGELLDCAARGEDAYENLGFARERRPFAAHMTVGRVRDDRSDGRMRDAIDALEINRARQSVDSITVIQSVLGPAGASYSALGRFRFGGAGQ